MFQMVTCMGNSSSYDTLRDLFMTASNHVIKEARSHGSSEFPDREKIEKLVDKLVHAVRKQTLLADYRELRKYLQHQDEE